MRIFVLSVESLDPLGHPGAHEDGPVGVVFRWQGVQGHARVHGRLDADGVPTSRLALGLLEVEASHEDTGTPWRLVRAEEKQVPCFKPLAGRGNYALRGEIVSLVPPDAAVVCLWDGAFWVSCPSSRLSSPQMCGPGVSRSILYVPVT